MRKTLIGLLIGLSSGISCVSQQPKCPSDEELLKAGFRIYSASEMIDSPKDLDHRLAQSNLRMANEFYFGCKDDNHTERHYQEAMESASKYFGIDDKGKRRFAKNVAKIRNEIAPTSYVKQ
ncbi:MAG: hypothetical protein AABW58_01050 [Nanoarchaeota archaeon]